MTLASTGRKVVLTAICLATALGMGFAGSAANAATSTPAYGNIDGSKTGSIIIHKHEHQNGTSDTGTPDGTDNITTPGIDGVTFTVYKVNDLDLTQTNSWDGLKDYQVPSDTTASSTLTINNKNYTLTQQGNPVVTANGGLATAGNLPVGAYVVIETAHPANVVDIAQPFLVTIPYPDNQGTSATNGWLYDVNVYPKNGTTTINKTVSSQGGLGLGSVASFPTTTDIPAIADNASFSYYMVSDPMDSRLTNVTASSVTVGGTAVDTTYYTVNTTSNTVTVSFTQAGLAWLKTQAGKKVITTFTGTVASLGDGTVVNKANLYVDTQVSPNPPTPPVTPPVNPPNPPIPSNEVKQYWGDLKIQKLDAGDKSTALQGATFEVYEAKDPYAATCSATMADNATAISVNGATTFTSDAKGSIDIAGLFVSDNQNAPIDAIQRCYVIKETQAPAGYVTPSGADALNAVAVKTGATSGFDITVDNSKEVVPGLPLTGSQTSVIMAVLGIALIGGAAGLAIRRRSNQR